MTGKRVRIKVLGMINGFIFLTLSIHAPGFSQVNDTVQTNYLGALKMVGEGNYDNAISQFQKIIQNSPDFSEGFRKLVETYIFVNEYEAAQVYFEKLLQAGINKPASLYSLARIDFARKNYDEAIRKLKEVIDLDPRFVDAYSYRGGLPEVYNAKNDLDTAIGFFSEIIKKDPDNVCAYYGLARSHLKMYEWDAALELLFKTIELDPDFTIAYHSMIFIYLSTSRYNKTLEFSKKLQSIADRVNDFEMLSYSTMMIGTTYFLKGDYLNSLYYLNEALTKAKNIGDKRREGSCINNIAAVYAMSGNYQKSIEYFKSALLLSQKVGNKNHIVYTLINIGHVCKDQGSFDQALEYYDEALEMSRMNKFKYLESITLSSMAEVYQFKKQFTKALAFMNYALEIAKEIEEKSQEGYILKSLGNLHMDLGKFHEASIYLRKALAIGESTQDIQIIWESQAGLGSCFAKQGILQQAITYYANAISIYDSVRSNLNIESLGNNFLEDKYEAYPSIVQLLAKSGKYNEAFVYVNKYKAKAILDVLFQGQNYLNELLSENIRIQLNEITANLEAFHNELSQELSRSEKDNEKVLTLDQKITDLEVKKAAIIEDLKRKHSQYYHLTSQEVLDSNDIQERILSNEQALLQYIVGPEELSLFVVTSDTLIYTQVSVSRDSIHSILEKLSPIFASGSRKDRFEILNPQIADFSISPAHKLFEILIKPVESWLQNTKELIIVPDDILFYLPFEMLVYDTATTETEYDFENARFLLEKYEISYVTTPNQVDKSQQITRKPNKGILAFGNPNFDSGEDSRMVLVSSEISSTQGIMRGDKLAKLPNSEVEVKEIGKVFGGTGNRILVGNEATEENLKKNAADYRILHFATHFLINDDQPLYSKIVLAQSGNSKEDGYLQTYEVFNMKLNADLVVLSACNTGLGTIRKGEGVIGITRAFLYAGVPSLLASLWNVDDQSTAIIMKSFYQYLQSGSNKRQALRLAKLDYFRSAKGAKKDPFYWAPFILIGDWTSVDIETNTNKRLGLIIIMGLFVAITVFWLNRIRIRVSSN